MADLLHPKDAGEEEGVADTPFDPGDFVLAMTADDQMEAQLLVAACEEADVPAILQSPRSGPVGTIASPVDAFNILVPEKDLQRATEILRERREALTADPDGAALAAEAEELASEPKT